MANKPVPRTCAEIFQRGESKKRRFIDRAVIASKLTIPAIFPPDGHNQSQSLHIPNQSFGAKACNNLASKMMLALFPPNTPFFRLDLGLRPENPTDAEKIQDYNSLLADVGEQVIGHLETTTLRSSMANSMLLDIITGNSLADISDKANIRVFNLRQYVVERDPQGTVIDLVLKEELSPHKMDPGLLATHFKPHELKAFEDDSEAVIEVYTRQHLVDGSYKVYQEINDIRVADTEGTYPMDGARFVASRWRSVDGEDYGRGLVEEYLGDFLTYDGFCKDMSLASKQAAKVIFTVPPNSYLDAKDIAEADSGDVLTGDADDVKTIAVDKLGDFKMAYERADKLERSLSEAFLMHSSVQRDAERVTAEEIRYMAQELEDSLGGVYSVYGQELQRPLLNRLLKVLTKEGVIPPIPKEIKLKITTGLDALGRSHETNKLMTLLRSASEVLGPEVIQQRLKPDAIIQDLGNGLGVDVEKYLKSDEEMAEDRKQMLENSVAQSAAPGVIQEAVGGMINQQQGNQ